VTGGGKIAIISIKTPFKNNITAYPEDKRSLIGL